MKKRKLRKRGRPPRLEMPVAVEGVTPEEVAELVLKVKPKSNWRYEQEYLRKHGSLPK